MPLYEFVAIYNPPKTVDGKDNPEKARIIVTMQCCLAKDDKQAAIYAARAIPGDFLDKLDHVEVAVRPF